MSNNKEDSQDEKLPLKNAADLLTEELNKMAHNVSKFLEPENEQKIIGKHTANLLNKRSQRANNQNISL